MKQDSGKKNFDTQNISHTRDPGVRDEGIDKEMKYAVILLPCLAHFALYSSLRFSVRMHGKSGTYIFQASILLLACLYFGKKRFVLIRREA